jgi:hypothetical protein
VLKILLAGRDVRLMTTRAAVLKKISGNVSHCMGSQVISKIRGERPDLVVLCHSLLEGEAEAIADEIHKSYKTTKVLMTLSEVGTAFPLKDEKFDAMCLSRPERLIACVNELVKGTLPSRVNVNTIKNDEGATSLSGLNTDCLM